MVCAMEDTNLTKQALNNEIDAMRRKLKVAQVNVIRKLVRRSRLKTTVKVRDGSTAPTTDKKALILEDILKVKKLDLLEVAKFSLTNTKTLAEVSGKISEKEKAMMRLLDDPKVKAAANSFRSRYPLWQVQVPSMFELLNFQRNVLKKLPKNEVKRNKKAKQALVARSEEKWRQRKINPRKLEGIVELPEEIKEKSKVDKPKVKAMSTKNVDAKTGLPPTVAAKRISKVKAKKAKISTGLQSKQNLPTTESKIQNTTEMEMTFDGGDSTSLRSKRQTITPKAAKETVAKNLKTLSKEPDNVTEDVNVHSDDKSTLIDDGIEKNFIYATALDLVEFKNEEAMDTRKVGEQNDANQAEQSTTTNAQKVDEVKSNKRKFVKPEKKSNVPAVVKKTADETSRVPLKKAVLAEKLIKLSRDSLSTFERPAARNIQKALNLVRGVAKLKDESAIVRIKLEELAEDQTVPISGKLAKSPAVASTKEAAVSVAYKMKSSFFMSTDGQCFSDEEPSEMDARNPTFGAPLRGGGEGGQETSKDSDRLATDNGVGVEENSQSETQLKRPRLHPSWIAKKAQRDTGVALADCGKKIYFDGDLIDQVNETPDINRVFKPRPQSRLNRIAKRAELNKGNERFKEGGDDAVDNLLPGPSTVHSSWKAKKEQSSGGIAIANQGRRIGSNNAVNDNFGVDRTGLYPNQKPYIGNERRSGPSPRMPSSKQANNFFEEKLPQKEEPSNLHPSWAAKLKQRGIGLANQGKKIVFDDNISDAAEPPGRENRDSDEIKQSRRAPISRFTSPASISVDHHYKDNNSTVTSSQPEELSSLHPSWAAKLKQRDSGLALANQGKKIVFDDNSSEISDSLAHENRYSSEFSERRNAPISRFKSPASGSVSLHFYEDKSPSMTTPQPKDQSHLHPSWAAKLKQRDSGLAFANRGKKITFDDD